METEYNGLHLCLVTYYYSFLIVLMFSQKMSVNLSENLIKEEYKKGHRVTVDPEADPS